MEWTRLHRWEVSVREAERIQSSLAEKIAVARGAWQAGACPQMAGAVVGGQVAAVVVMHADGWEIAETRHSGQASPEIGRYRRGLMAFTYGPMLLQTFERVRARPHVVMFRGHGIAHSRRCGMAAHLGLLLETPSLGCADKLLCGAHEAPGPKRGDWTPVTHRGETVGAAVTTRDGARPLFASPGFALDVEQTVEIVLQATPHHRMPEPLRQARLAAKRTQGLTRM
jgi:deoxyribonuclease V